MRPEPFDEAQDGACPRALRQAQRTIALEPPSEASRPAVGVLSLIEAMGIDPSRTGVELQDISFLIASPAFGTIQQCLADSVGAALGSNSQVLYPGPLPEPH